MSVSGAFSRGSSRCNEGVSLVTVGGRNKKYEAGKKSRGLVKMTVWVPEEALVDFKNMAVFCCDERGCVPFMVRDLVTGKFRKGV